MIVNLKLTRPAEQDFQSPGSATRCTGFFFDPRRKLSDLRHREEET
jgi:hypothetical protein